MLIASKEKQIRNWINNYIFFSHSHCMYYELHDVNFVQIFFFL
jgi:hypothetical protein